MDAAPQTQLSYGGLWKAWVAVDGKPVEVYKVEEKPTLKKTTCYIEARDGANFTVNLLDDQTFLSSDRTRWLFVDGKNMRGTLLTRGDASVYTPPGNQTRIFSFTGRPDSASSEQPFAFSKPVVTDDADIACKDENIVKNLRTIQLELFRVTAGDLDLLEIQNIVEAAASVSPPPAAGSNAANKGKKRQAVTITLSSDDESAGEDSKDELNRLRAKIVKLEEVVEGGLSNKKVKKEKGGPSEVIVIDDD